MNVKRWIITSIIVFVVAQLVGYLVHMVILSGSYQATAHLWRSMEDMQSKMWIMYAADLIWAFLFVYIFTKGYEAKGWLEGLRYGLVIGLFVSIPMSIGTYVTQPMPFNLAASWFVFGVLTYIICGVVAALVYKK